MTCVVGLVDSGRVWMGADSAGMDDRYAMQIRKDPKVFRVGGTVFGFTSSFRMGQLLAHSLRLPDLPGRSDDLMGWMVGTLIGEVRRTLKDGGYARKDAEQEQGGVFLVGIRGRLFMVDCDYQVGETICGYNAVGCGDQIALGALFASPDRSPHERVLTALSAAAELSGGVRGPFRIIAGGSVAA